MLRNSLPWLSALTAVFCAGCGPHARRERARDAESKTAATQPVVGSWSKPVSGLCGRLRVVFEEFGSGGRHAVFVELRNDMAKPVAVRAYCWNVHASVFDSSGAPLAQTSYPMSGPIFPPQWAVIPGHASLAYRVDMRTVGVPTDRELLAVSRGMWGLKRGRYIVKMKMTGVKQEGPANQWTGELLFPAVEIIAAKRGKR